MLAANTNAALLSAKGQLLPRGPFGVKIRDLLWLIAFNLLFFQSWIQNTFGFSYIDESMTLVLFLCAVAECIRRREVLLGWDGRLAIVLLACMCTFGLMENAAWGIQTIARAIAVDLFTCIKFPIALLSAYIVFRGNTEIFTIAETEAKLLAVLMAILSCANLVIDFGMGTDPRYGLRASFMFIFGHPTGVVAVCAGLVCILCRNYKRNSLWIALALLVTILSLRSKGIAFAALAAFLLVTFGKRNRLTVFHVIAGLVVLAFVGYDQFMSYFVVNDGYARHQLLVVSFQVARDFFPFGSGFATYGSAVTGDLAAYSFLYYLYGLSNVQGLSPGNAVFLSDAFWPTVIGQFGFIGLVVFVGSIILLFRCLYRRAGKGRLSVFLCFAYLCISSSAESAFFHPMSVMLAMSLGIVLSGIHEDVSESLEANV